MKSSFLGYSRNATLRFRKLSHKHEQCFPIAFLQCKRKARTGKFLIFGKDLAHDLIVRNSDSMFHVLASSYFLIIRRTSSFTHTNVKGVRPARRRSGTCAEGKEPKCSATSAPGRPPDNRVVKVYRPCRNGCSCGGLVISSGRG